MRLLVRSAVVLVLVTAADVAGLEAQANARWYIATYTNHLLVWDEASEEVALHGLAQACGPALLIRFPAGEEDERAPKREVRPIFFVWGFGRLERDYVELGGARLGGFVLNVRLDASGLLVDAFQVLHVSSPFPIALLCIETLQELGVLLRQRSVDLQARVRPAPHPGAVVQVRVRGLTVLNVCLVVTSA